MSAVSNVQAPPQLPQLLLQLHLLPPQLPLLQLLLPRLVIQVG